MTACLFVSDLHGHPDRYRKLFGALSDLRPRALFIGGDLLPNPWRTDASRNFIGDFLLPELSRLREELGEAYPRVFVILGNEDGRRPESALIAASEGGLVSYIHGRKERIDRWTVYGYAYVPPTPFRLKDWERYDVSRSVEPGCISPEDGLHTVPFDPDEVRFGTIERDLDSLAVSDDLGGAVFLFHTPPYRTNLDRIPPRGRMTGRTQLDAHIGSIAVRRFIETRQPLLAMHGHAHESARLSGSWRDRIGPTVLLSAAHDGPELALVRFDLDDPDGADRDLL